MTLLSGEKLNVDGLFAKGALPLKQASSVDLTIGHIFDHSGKKVEGPFRLEPGHMVQVCSAEVFALPNTVTAHVTYKTTLTKQGIWALTVGIIDPGWEGPIATTLLNFSRKDFAVAEGDAFLRASFFDHPAVPASSLRKAPPLDKYLSELQKGAATDFPRTFLDSDKIAQSAGEAVLKKVRDEAFAWVGGIAVLFALIQIGAMYVQPAYTSKPAEHDLVNLKQEILYLRDRIRELEKSSGDK
jgi:hypothetical protein